MKMMVCKNSLNKSLPSLSLPYFLLLAISVQSAYHTPSSSSLMNSPSLLPTSRLSENSTNHHQNEHHPIPQESIPILHLDFPLNEGGLDSDLEVDGMGIGNDDISKISQTDGLDEEAVSDPIYLLCYAQMANDLEKVDLSRGELVKMTVDFEKRSIFILGVSENLSILLPIRQICEMKIVSNSSGIQCLCIKVGNDDDDDEWEFAKEEILNCRYPHHSLL